MEPISRREFLKVGGAGVGAAVLFEPLGAVRGPGEAFPAIPLVKRIGEKTSICAYCAAGCGVLVAAEGDNLINIEGYPDHPINRGALCSKAQSLYQVRTVKGELNRRRLTKVLYRAPNSSAWQEKPWDWALGEIAKRVKQTRDANWIGTDTAGNLVNRTEAIAHLGGAAHDDEECYLLTKMNRALGLVYIEHQARI